MSEAERPDADIKLEALYTIFEKHLYDFDDNEESEAKFIEKIVADYVKFLTSNKVVIPRRWQHHIAEELRDQVHKMLVKKMYGCLSIKEFLHTQGDRADKRKTAKKKYSRIF